MDCRVKPGNDNTADNSLNLRYKLFRLVSV
jgi:hypothetical protein